MSGFLCGGAPSEAPRAQALASCEAGHFVHVPAHVVSDALRAFSRSSDELDVGAERDGEIRNEEFTEGIRIAPATARLGVERKRGPLGVRLCQLDALAPAVSAHDAPPAIGSRERIERAPDLTVGSRDDLEEH